MIRQQRNGEVFRLLNRIIDTSKSNTKTNIKSGDQVITLENGDKIIRREAKNDDWY